MVSPRRLATLLIALALALSPATAFGQGAGDDQYEDPFGDEVPQSATPTPTPAPGGDTAQEDDLSEGIPGGGTEPADEAADDQTPEAPAVTAQRSQLPATGSDALTLGMLGLALVMGGAGLRLRLRDGAPLA